MGDSNYDKVLEKISSSSGKDKEEVKRLVEAKRAKLSDLISYEGAAQIVAAELGVNFEEGMLKLDELLPGMRKANVIGKIINLFPIRSYTNKKGEESKVANMILADDTSNAKVVLWDTNHISLLENGTLNAGDSVEISNGSVRDGEIHLGSFSEFKKSDQVFENVVTEKQVKEKSIADFNVGDSVKIRAFIVQSFEPRFFNVCGECKKKVTTDGENFVCMEHGKVTPDRRALINIVIDDGTETIRTVLFHDSLPSLGLTALEDPIALGVQRQEMLGKELNFEGTVKMNNYFNQPEFGANNVTPVDLDALATKLEK